MTIKSFRENKNASRNNFSDAIDFVGWYNSNSRRINSIDYFDAKNFYLAYHEGNSGFARQSYREKQWLINAANRVQRNSEIFSSQLKNCENELSKGLALETLVLRRTESQPGNKLLKGLIYIL